MKQIKKIIVIVSVVFFVASIFAKPINTLAYHWSCLPLHTHECEEDDHGGWGCTGGLQKTCEKPE